MRIGLILSSAPNYSETFFISQIIGLQKKGYTVELFLNSNGERRSQLPHSLSIYLQPDLNKKLKLIFILLGTLFFHPLVTLHFIKLERLSHRYWIKILKNIIINSHILGRQLDWVHFGFATVALGRENLAKAIGARSAVSFRGYDISLYSHQHPGCYNILWEKIDKVHTISDDLYKQGIDLGLNLDIPMQKITPAVDVTKFKAPIRKNLHEPLRILSVGRLTWKKGYEYALKALRLLKDKEINFEYHIIGEGEYREAIIYAIHQLKLTEYVILKGQLSHNEVIKQMEWADIYIQPSIQEGFCNAVLEAQSMGLLCIVTNAEGLGENILDGETGWVIPKRSPKKIANKIIELISLRNIDVVSIRQSAIDRVQNEFNIKKQEEHFNDFYKN